MCNIILKVNIHFTISLCSQLYSLLRLIDYLKKEFVMKAILLYASTGGGHRSSASAIAEALENLNVQTIL
jgi:ClpP class serine protease